MRGGAQNLPKVKSLTPKLTHFWRALLLYGRTCVLDSLHLDPRYSTVPYVLTFREHCAITFHVRNFSISNSPRSQAES